MAENSSISWTHHTFNPWRGCTKVSEGCKFCYADTLSGRNPSVLGKWGPKGTRPIAADAYWLQALKWDRDAKAAGERRRVFCASLADVFEGPETMPAAAVEPVQFARLELFALIHGTPNLDWLILTKRPENAALFFRKEMEEFIMAARNRLAGTARHAIYEASVARGMSHFPNWPNIWIGTSVENQAAADERIPHLLKIPAKVRFLSCEPLLGPVEFSDVTRRSDAVSRLGRNALEGIHWVIAGGESGPNARFCNPSWARSLRDQCQSAGVPFHFKQWGEYLPDTQNTDIDGRESLPADYFGGIKMGVKKAGRLLDGVLHDAFPEVANAR